MSEILRDAIVEVLSETGETRLTVPGNVGNPCAEIILGPSVISSLWKTLMYEDALMKAQIQMAQSYRGPWSPPDPEKVRLLAEAAEIRAQLIQIAD